MKDATQQWLNFAEIDLRTCEKLLGDDLLTSVVAFHSQQIVEKCFKSIIEKEGLQLARIHTLARLFGLIQNSIPFTVDTALLQNWIPSTRPHAIRVISGYCQKAGRQKNLQSNCMNLLNISINIRMK